MNRKLTILVLIGLLLIPTILLAVMTPQQPPATGTVTTMTELVSKIDKVATALYSIIFALAVVFVLVSAFQFLTAAGNPEKITSARQMLIYALIAIAVAVIAWGLPTLITSILGV